MDLEKFKQQLGREAHEYLADLREIRNDLKNVDGWIALGLGILVILMAAAWIIVSLGFNPANDHVSSFMYKFGLRSCRPINNFNGVIVFIDFIVLIFLTVISLGNVVNMMRRASQGYPREPRDLIITTSLMLVVGIGGIIFMLKIC
jgi:amino acid transporter